MDTATETEILPRALEWGLQPPAEAKCAYGARAIYKNGYERVMVRRKVPKSNPPRYTRKEKFVNQCSIELLWDRQSIAGGTNADRVKLRKWLDAKGLKLLKKFCEENGVAGSEDHQVRIEDGEFTLIANPRASYGYLYIGAWI